MKLKTKTKIMVISLIQLRGQNVNIEDTEIQLKDNFYSDSVMKSKPYTFTPI